MILDPLKQRLRASLAGPAPSAADLADARRLAAAVNDEGRWADLDYALAERSAREATRHLERTLALARAQACGGGELDAALTRALDWWLVHDPQGPHWWHNQIGVPRLVGSTALLFEGGLSTGARGKVVEILARARWAHGSAQGWTDWTGANLLWIAFNVLLRGCLENVPALCEEACRRVHGEIRVAPVGGEGLQADMSFHQHGPLLHNGGDGLAFSENGALFLHLTHGTPWQGSAECLRLFTSFLLEGQQWMIRGDVFDYGALDREITRGPRSLAAFAAAVEGLADQGITGRRSEMAAFCRRLRGANEGALSGHRHYWRSDFAVHQRPAFYTSVRMSSQRTRAPERSHEEGKQSHHLADGLTYLLRDGGEYRDIFPVWDWRRLPGTTVVQAPGALDPAEAGGRGGRTFVGGVSDGEYGLAVMELGRGGLRARKAWFYFDESFVCLGAGIGCDDEAGPVFTSINQCLLRGPVTAYGKGGETHVLAPGKSYDLSAAYRLEHDGVVYHFPAPVPVRARVAAQTGSWAAIGSGSPEPVTRDVFSAWVDHGVQPGLESYAYTVLPAGGVDGRAAADHEISQVQVLANSPALQAVWHGGLRQVGIVFWEPGVLSLPDGGRVAVNRPCAVICQDRRPEGMRVSIANPTNEAATIHAEYGNRCLCFELPGGLKGGQSMTRVL